LVFYNLKTGGQFYSFRIGGFTDVIYEQASVDNKSTGSILSVPVSFVLLLLLAILALFF
jgi:hypothetical protein